MKLKKTIRYYLDVWKWRGCARKAGWRYSWENGEYRAPASPRTSASQRFATVTESWEIHQDLFNLEVGRCLEDIPLVLFYYQESGGDLAKEALAPFLEARMALGL